MAQHVILKEGLNISHVPQTLLQRISHGTLCSCSQSVAAVFQTSKMVLSKLVSALFWASVTFNWQATAAPTSASLKVKSYNDAPLQDLVTWDEHSVFVRGERIMLFNGEFHPYRLPVTSLWLDVFQKLKAAGFSGVSFYTDWYLRPKSSPLAIF